MDVNPNIKNYLTLMLLSLIWSTSFIAIEFAIETASPVLVAFGRTFLASVILSLIVLKLKLKFPRDIKTWRVLFWSGLTGATLPFMLFSWGQQYLDSGTTGILMAFTPLSTMFLAYMMTDNEKLTPYKLLGGFLGLIGVFILLGGVKTASIEMGILPPLAIILATIGYAFSSIVLKKTAHLSSVVGSAGLMIMANLSLIPFLIWQWNTLNFNLSMNSILGISFLGVFSTAIGVIIMLRLIHKTSASFMSLNNYLVPGLAILWGVMFLGERFSVNTFLGFLLIISGLATASYRPLHRKTQTKNPP